jgi:pimeloyl-ACP methyl ester carboxylesterase
MASTRTRTIETADGRTLGLYEGGDPSGAPVVIHHGTPGSGLLYAETEALAREQGVRLIGYDRPGYGDSSRAPGRTVASCAADVNTIADALDLDRYTSWGLSGGGPHVLACAALCDERLTAVASLAAVAPWDSEGLDYLAGMGEANVEEFDAVLAGEAALRPVLDRDRAEMLAAAPSELVNVWSSLLGEQDRSVLSEEFAGYILDSGALGTRDGVDGWLDDNLAFVQPWGFTPASIDRPVLLLHGTDDRFVPVSHGRWLAAHIPGVEARISAADGHLTLLERRMHEVNDWLLSHS